MGCCSSKKPNRNAVDISHFVKLRAIGKGGFGLVHVVKKLTPPQAENDLFAMKTMAKQTLLQSEWHLSVAWLERNVLRIVQSPFLPKLHWAFQDRARLYLVMDFLPGGDLGFYVDKHHGLPEESIVFYIAEIALGIQALHDQYIVHHDIKPSNILLDSSGHARITDFGLATILDAESGFRTRLAGGTPGFMPPESIMGKFHVFEPDFFALGSTIYYCYKQRAPFVSNEQMMEQKAIPHSWRLIPDVARNLIERLLKFDMNERLTDWDEFERHEFFRTIDWDQMRKCSGKGPINIETTARNFPMEVCALDALVPDEAKPIKDQTVFDGFEYDEDKGDASAMREAPGRIAEFAARLSVERSGGGASKRSALIG
ncbi:Protein kinase domain-containing protein [Plasmodiophora brassicae]|uniref:Protein kinase domain-containing protein n=1 Tax=Plasmodiophora brassicae TaxID=37360 RepID=A0A0G4IIV8_PLABS|nr:hypothetical protein PBRA_009621 [Plasmodiophora brassicae]